MSSDSSELEIDVLESILLDASYDEERKAFGDILTRCQVINDSIDTLHKKFSAILGKVTKLERLQLKSVWQNRRTFGYSSRTFGQGLSGRIKSQVKCRRPKKKNSAPVSEAISYTPTPLSVLQDAEGTSEAPPVEESLPAQGSQQPEQASFLQPQNPGFTQAPHVLAPYAAQSFPTYCISKNFTQGPSYKSFVLSSGSSGSLVSTACSSAAVTETVEQHPARTKLMAGLTVQDIESTSQCKISSASVASFAAGSSNGTDQSILKRSYSSPSRWSVDEVVQFLEQSDSENFSPLSHLFREHAIDGKALLLLTQEAMIKYMDINVGTALKIYNHIKELRRKKSLKN